MFLGEGQKLDQWKRHLPSWSMVMRLIYHPLHTFVLTISIFGMDNIITYSSSRNQLKQELFFQKCGTYVCDTSSATFLLQADTKYYVPYKSRDSRVKC